MDNVMPTIEQVMKRYKAVAATERMKSGRPCHATVRNTIKGTQLLCEAARLSLDAQVCELTRRRIDEALAVFMAKGLQRISALTHVDQLRALFAKWTLPYYKDAGWIIPTLELPVFRATTPRYKRPGANVLANVRKWYLRLEGGMWFAATMMLEFAMRNNDVLRLESGNFIQREGQWFLSYMPHKTALTSGRTVFWPIHRDIWAKIEALGGFSQIDYTCETFCKMNRQLRGLGFTGSKASYELRKICIDHVYQKFGAEMATSISGDDIKTITHYYADPSQPNIGNVRILDLL